MQLTDLCNTPPRTRLSYIFIARIIKTITFIMLIGCLQVSAKGHGQGNISLSLKNATMKQAFKEIEKVSSYSFVYSSRILDNTKNINLKVINANIDDVLTICFQGQPLIYSIIDKVIIVKQKPANFLSKTDKGPQPEQITFIDIKGKVINENGEPLSGATVSIKGKSSYTVSDIKGEFLLTGIGKGEIIIVTYIGYTNQEIKLSGKDEIIVQLKLKIGELDVISVSTGYQDIPKERATGSFSKVDNKLFNQQTGTNVLQRLEGVVSSLIFNVGKNGSSNGPPSKTNITIRGFSTINGPLDPLIVLDNFIYEGEIGNINPNDIESVTILKDAAASSIWGARAGNGVIVLTTKKGKYNQLLKIELNSNWTVTENPDLFNLPQISSADYIDVEQFLYSRGYFNSSFDNSENPGITPAVELFRKKELGQISATDSTSQINALKAIDSRDQYIKYFYQKAITQQYSLNLRGGSSNMAWLISGAYDKIFGSLAEKINKVNLRVNNTYSPTKNMQIGVGVYYTSQRNVSAKPAYNSIKIRARDVPYLKFVDDQGNPIAIARNYRDLYTDTVGNGMLLNWKYYPLEDYKHDRTTTNLQELLANIFLNYQVDARVSINVNYQYQKQWSFSDRLSDLESFNARDLINLYSNLGTTVVGQRNPIPVGGVLGKSNAGIGSQNLRGQINFSNTWGNHSISALIGTEIRETRSDYDSYTIYGYNQDPLTFSNVDFNTSYPTILNGSFRTIPGGPSVQGEIINRFVSAYGNFLYSYKQKYSLSGSVRRDGANIFGLSTNDKFKPLWSAGLGWALSKEPFYKSSLFPYLKLKSTIGHSGNLDLSKSPLPIASYSPGDPYTGFPFANINTINNPALRWEEVGQWNIGVEFAMKDQLLSGSVEYYEKKGTDLYGQSPYDYTGWGLLNEITGNVASMKGRGVDIVLKSKNIDKGLKWVTDFLYSYNASKTTEYFATSSKNLLNLNPQNISPVIGKPLYAIVAYKWGGLNSLGDPQGFLDGKLSTDYIEIENQSNLKGLESGAFTYIGPAIPTSFGSLINEFMWKDFSVSINLVYKFGYYFQKSSISYSSLYDNGTGHKDFAKRWIKQGDELITNVPAMVYSDYSQFSKRDQFYTQSEINVFKGDNIRIQYVNIDYEISKRNKGIPSLRFKIYINASNLGIIWRANKEKLDPDYPASIPTPKRYTIGIRAEF